MAGIYDNLRPLVGPDGNIEWVHDFALRGLGYGCRKPPTFTTISEGEKHLVLRLSNGKEFMLADTPQQREMLVRIGATEVKLA